MTSLRNVPTSAKATTKSPAGPARRKGKLRAGLADWLPKEFAAELEAYSQRPKAESLAAARLGAFASLPDCGTVIEGLRKRGWSGAQLTALLMHTYWTHTWGEVRQRREWWSWTLEERERRAAALALACRRLQQELAQMEGVLFDLELHLLHDPQQLMLIRVLRGIDPIEPTAWEGGRARPKTLADPTPLGSLAKTAESLPSVISTPGRQDELRARRLLVCSVAAMLQRGQCSSWANYTSLLVSAVTGQELSDSRVRQIIKAHPDLLQNAKERLNEPQMAAPGKPRRRSQAVQKKGLLRGS